MDIPVIHSLTYLLECCCAYLIHPKLHFCIKFFPIKLDKTVLAVFVKVLTLTRLIFITNHGFVTVIDSVLIHCSLLSIRGLKVQSWYTPFLIIPLCCL